MKTIYISHSTDFDYENELYKPVRNIRNIKFIFPHAEKSINSKNRIRKCSALIAEVSRPSHGVGVEIGWANSFGVPVIFLFKKGSKPSKSLNFISKRKIEYNRIEDVLDKIEKSLNL